MKAIILSLLFYNAFGTNVNAGGVYWFQIEIDDTTVGGFDPYPTGPTKAPPTWVGKAYVSNVWVPEANQDTDIGFDFYYDVSVYFQPGDTIYTDLDTITAAGEYQSIYFIPSCGSNAHALVKFYCYYMPDSLEPYYLSHFDQQYIDSLYEAKDSLAAISAYLTQPPPTFFYPNPVINNLVFEDMFYEDATIQFTLFDMTGKMVLNQNFDVPAGVASKNIDLSMLSSGVYLMRYNSNEKQITQRIVKL